jgi:hypothetical protein
MSVDSIARGMAAAMPGLAARGITPTLAKRASALAAGLTAVKNNTADCIILIAGDSTSVGYAYGDAGSNTNAALWNPAAYLAERLRQMGIPASTDAWLGTQVRTTDTIADVALFDPRRTFGTGWAIGTAKCAGGRTVRKASATAGACSYTPYSTCDRVDVIYAGNSGAFTANFDGGAATTWSAPGGATTATTQTVVAASSGQHVLNFDTTSSAVANIVGMIARDSTRRRVIIVNASMRGIAMEEVLHTNTNPGIEMPAMISYLAPALGVPALGINDIRSGGGVNASTVTLSANITELANLFDAVGDVMHLAPHRISPADEGAGATMAQLNTVYRTIAAAGSHSLVDASDAAGGSYAIQNARGYMADGLHFKEREVARRIGYAMADTAVAAACLGGFSLA